MLSPNEIENIELQAYGGYGSKLMDVCKIYPLKISEILDMGMGKYQAYLNTLLLTPIEISQIIKEKTGEEPKDEIDPLQYLLQSAEHDDSFFLELHNMFFTFIREETIFLPKMGSIVVGSPEKKRMINSQNFKDFQDILRIQNHKEVVAAPPENETAWERKMRLSREKVAAIKKKQAQKSNEGLSFLELLEIGDTFKIDSMNCTLVSFYRRLHREQLREKWNQDLQMLCAGADSKKIKTKYWGESSNEK